MSLTGDIRRMLAHHIKYNLKITIKSFVIEMKIKAFLLILKWTKSGIG